MAIEIAAANEVPESSSANGSLIFEGLETLDGSESSDAGTCRRRGIKAKVGEVTVVDEPGGVYRVLVGAGKRDTFSAETIRRAAGAYARAVAECESVAFDLRGVQDLGVPVRLAAQAWTEGALLAEHRFAKYKSERPKCALERATIVAGDSEEAAAGIERGRIVSDAVNLARDLVNEPASEMTPTRLAEIAGEVAARAGLGIEIFDEDRIAAERLGGLLGVARGSAEPPRLVKLTYEPDSAAARAVNGHVPTVVIVGKGITFDSGGLSLKSGDGMMTMKTDMSGAAAVVATLGACRGLGVPVRVIGIAPITENMPSGTATKPGDVLRIRNGKTIEVLNTDAEGRLVLADGLSLAVEEEPDAIVDLATLTGACVVALGRKMAGVMGNDDALVGQVREASDRAGEPMWPLPLPEEYKSHYESEIADMKNIGSPGQAGTLVAGLILSEFVGDVPWAHLDIAGPARSEDDRDYLHKGATGFGVRTMIELLGRFRPVRDRAAH